MSGAALRSAGHVSWTKWSFALPSWLGGCWPARGLPHIRYRGDPWRTGALPGAPVGSAPPGPTAGIAAHPADVSRAAEPSPRRSTSTISTTIRHLGSHTRVVKYASCWTSSVATGAASTSPPGVAAGISAGSGADEHVAP